MSVRTHIHTSHEKNNQITFVSCAQKTTFLRNITKRLQPGATKPCHLPVAHKPSLDENTGNIHGVSKSLELLSTEHFLNHNTQHPLLGMRLQKPGKIRRMSTLLLTVSAASSGCYPLTVVLAPGAPFPHPLLGNTGQGSESLGVGGPPSTPHYQSQKTASVCAQVSPFPLCVRTNHYNNPLHTFPVGVSPFKPYQINKRSVPRS